jgi:hypothetical protein
MWIVCVGVVPIVHPGDVPGLTEPLSLMLRRGLRDEVLALRRQSQRRLFPVCVHVGEPGGRSVSFTTRAADALDDSDRAAIVAALLGTLPAGHTGTICWLTRPGELSWSDVDADWLGPAERAFAEAGHCLTLVVITRRGWFDPRSGTHRQWKRLRDRTRSTPGPVG